MKFLLHTIFFLGIGFGILYAYLNYWDDIHYAIFDEPLYYTVYINNVAITVTLADEPAERKQGLSGTESLGELEGKLFLFDAEGDHGIWMKDMNYAIDILWINDDLKIVHIEENVAPDTYPTIFGSDEPALYVLEMRSLFVSTYKIEEGDGLTLPPGLIPSNIKKKQETEYLE